MRANLLMNERYVEKLATPDVSIADLIGDVDPVKVAEGRSLADELTIHFGLVPRTHRGIFCINELPDLTEKVQVGLFNVMEERDVQVKGYRVRLPIDVLVVASANPEDYTSRGRIITPLKDRYAAQIRTHYPRGPGARAGGRAPGGVASPGGRRRRFTCPPSWRRSSGAHLPGAAQPGREPGLRRLGAHVDRELRDARRQRRAPRAANSGEAEAVPRISDLDALHASTSGKLELEYAGAERSESEIDRDLLKRATKVVFDERPARLEGWRRWWSPSTRAGTSRSPQRCPSSEVPGRARRDRAACARRRVARRRRLPGAARLRVEFILEGLHLSNRLNKSVASGARSSDGHEREGRLQPLGRVPGGILPRCAGAPSTRCRT